MHYPSFAEFRGAAMRGTLAPGSVALIFVEDEAAVEETLAHHLRIGFSNVVLLGAELDGIETRERLIRVTDAPGGRAWLAGRINALMEPLEGRWVHYCFNGEFLFFPFCESRTVADMTTFMTEERRTAVQSYAFDLYSDDLGRDPSGVSVERAHFDRAGYYAFQRFEGPEAQERQHDVFGGLGWRFEEHVPWERRRIDRITPFVAARGLTLDERFLLSEPEMNTVSCPWHHNLTCAVMSFRVAKSLKRNPGSTYEIASFMWPLSTRFSWHSRQLLELGLIEPGQWF